MTWCLMAEEIMNKRTILGFVYEKYPQYSKAKFLEAMTFGNRENGE